MQGRDAATAEQLRQDARLLADLGCFALVLECVPSSLATAVSAEINIPTIGIGAGAGCDGQVLVFHDMLGLFGGLKPKFVKQYAALGELAEAAIAQYAAEVRDGQFPGAEHEYAEQTSPGKVADKKAAEGKSGYLNELEAERD